MKRMTALLAPIALVLSGCGQTGTNDAAASAAVGGVFGAVTATALGGDRRDVLIGTFAGSTIGALAAQNQ